MRTSSGVNETLQINSDITWYVTYHHKMLALKRREIGVFTCIQIPHKVNDAMCTRKLRQGQSNKSSRDDSKLMGRPVELPVSLLAPLVS